MLRTTLIRWKAIHEEVINGRKLLFECDIIKREIAKITYSKARCGCNVSTQLETKGYAFKQTEKQP